MRRGLKFAQKTVIMDLNVPLDNNVGEVKNRLGTVVRKYF